MMSSSCNGLSISQTCHAKILVAVSPGNSINMAQESPKLLSHQLQFTNFQIVLLLLENLASFAEILFALVMSILFTVSEIHLVIMFVTLQSRVAGSQTPEEPQEHALSTCVWHCHLHFSPSATTHPSSPHHITTHLLVPQRHHWSLSWIKSCL